MTDAFRAMEAAGSTELPQAAYLELHKILSRFMGELGTVRDLDSLTLHHS